MLSGAKDPPKDVGSRHLDSVKLKTYEKSLAVFAARDDNAVYFFTASAFGAFCCA